MDATPINFGSASAFGASPNDDAFASGAVLPDGRLAQRWATLHEAAGLVAALAGEPAVPSGEVLAFADRLARVPQWRRDMAERGMEDLTAIMEPGIAALIAVHSAGKDATAPARALWDEFVAARDAVIALTASFD